MPLGTTIVDRQQGIICYNEKCSACDSVTFTCKNGRACADTVKKKETP